MSKRTFPFPVKRHGVTVMIYQQKSSSGYVSYQVRYYNGSRPHRVTRSNFEKAHAEAEAIAFKLAQGEADVLTLNRDDKFSYVRALEVLKDTGIPLDEAVRQFAQAHRLLEGGSLLEAVNIALRSQAQKCPPKTVAEVVDELVLHKSAKGRSKPYLNEMRIRLNRFKAAFHCQIGSVTTGQIEAFLLGLKVSGRTQNNFRRLIGTLFNHAVKSGYLPRDHRGVQDVEVASEKPNDIQIFSPEEISRLLACASPEITPFVALGAFAGIRHEEMKRLDWEDIDLVERYIQLPADAAKTKIRRLIPISDNLLTWLKPHFGKGPVVSYANMSKQLLWLADEAGVTWRHNGLRHSYVSYRTALVQNVGQVSLEAGNSPRIIERNYLKRVTASEAKRWFAVSFEQPPNLICLQSEAHAKTA